MVQNPSIDRFYFGKNGLWESLWAKYVQGNGSGAA